MAIIRPTDNDLLTVIAKMIITECGYTYSALYRDIRKSGINGRQIKFYCLYPIDGVWSHAKMPTRTIIKKVKKAVRLIFGKKYKINVMKNQMSFTIIHGDK